MSFEVNHIRKDSEAEPPTLPLNSLEDHLFGLTEKQIDVHFENKLNNLEDHIDSHEYLLTNKHVIELHKRDGAVNWHPSIANGDIDQHEPRYRNYFYLHTGVFDKQLKEINEDLTFSEKEFLYESVVQPEQQCLLFMNDFFKPVAQNGWKDLKPIRELFELHGREYLFDYYIKKAELFLKDQSLPIVETMMARVAKAVEEEKRRLKRENAEGDKRIAKAEAEADDPDQWD